MPFISETACTCPYAGTWGHSSGCPVLVEAREAMQLTPEQRDRAQNAYRAAVHRHYGDSLT